MKLGDFLTAINKSKEPLMDEDVLAEKEYPAFAVNRTLSYFPDTVLYANEVNQLHFADAKMQFDYLRGSVRPKSRFSRWHKTQKNEKVEIIRKVYGYSNQRATEIADLITDEQMDVLKRMLFTGGRKR